MGESIGIPSKKMMFNIKPGEIVSLDRSVSLFEVRAKGLTGSVALFRAYNYATPHIEYIGSITSGFSTDLSTPNICIYKDSGYGQMIKIKNNRDMALDVEVICLT